MQNKALLTLRKRIDALDRILIRLIGQRLKIARRIARIKKAKRLPIYDRKREDLIKAKIRKMAEKEQVDASALEEIYQILLRCSRSEMQKTN